ncbi:MAG: hypothetical protein AAF234_05290 [Pseudomonadota bacterium]
MNEDIAFGLALVAFILLAPIVFGIWVYNRDHRQCVALPNGLYLGYTAVFNFDKPAISAGGTIKFADGTPLVDQDLWSVFVSDTSAFGVAIGSQRDGGEAFAWRADTGVVMYRSNPEAYTMVVEEAGELNYGAGRDFYNPSGLPIGVEEIPRSRPTSYGPVSLMRILADMPEFESRSCATRLFKW